MDGVLEAAAVLCVCKLVCSLLCLPCLAASYNPVSYCCCCLLVFTDFLVAAFLTFFYVCESWLTELAPLSDVIALRFLIFLSHTYGAVLLLITPLIAVESLSTLLWPHRTASQTVDSDGQCCYVWEEEEDEEDSNDCNDKETKSSGYVVGYLCCLSVWVMVALNIKWGWMQEEVWTSACLHTDNSLIRCLPRLFRPLSSVVTPCWGMALLSLFILLLLTISAGLRIRQRARTHREKRGANNDDDACWQDLGPAACEPSRPPKSRMSELESAQSVDPGKTESSCTVHKDYSWNNVQMSAHHHGDFVLVAPECLSAGRGGQEQERARKGIPLTFITEEHVDSQHRSRGGWRRWGFPCPGVNVMIGFVGVLFIFVLPLNLSVNILLIRTIETLLELSIKSFASFAANPSNASSSHTETLV